MHKKPYVIAVIAAGGSSSRFGENKLFADLCGKSVIYRSVAAFDFCDCIDEIVISARRTDIPDLVSLAKRFNKVKFVVEGGSTRVHSVLNALCAIKRRNCIVAVHDGARPLVRGDLIARCVGLAASKGACVPAVKAKDTVKFARHNVVTSTPNREEVFMAQTPQCFEYTLLRGALSACAADDAAVTDDASAVEHIGFAPFVCDGDERNIKITTPHDLQVAEALFRSIE